MSALNADDLLTIADDVGAVTETLLELQRQMVPALRKAPSPKFAKLTEMWAARRGKETQVVVDICPSPVDVLHVVATALSDIELLLRTLPV